MQVGLCVTCQSNYFPCSLQILQKFNLMSKVSHQNRSHEEIYAMLGDMTWIVLQGFNRSALLEWLQLFTIEIFHHIYIYLVLCFNCACRIVFVVLYLLVIHGQFFYGMGIVFSNILYTEFDPLHLISVLFQTGPSRKKRFIPLGTLLFHGTIYMYSSIFLLLKLSLPLGIRWRHEP